MKPKLLQQLRKKDFTEFPVWKYWNEDNQELVLPERICEVSEKAVNSYIVLTEFQLNNGSIETGFSSPQDFSGLDYIQPVIILGDLHIALFKETEWSEEEKQQALLSLGKKESEVFPIRYITKVECDGIFKTGLVSDFNVQNDYP
jgi:hypothetical protein